MVVGNLDLLVDFRKAFDREVLVSAAAVRGNEEESIASSNTQPAQDGASAMDHAVSAQDVFPSSMFEPFPGLSVDALTILEKIPDGRIPGIHYAAGEGVIYIRKDVRDRDDAISKFQKAYQGLVLGKKMKVELVELPVECSETAVTKVLEEFHSRYPNCHFSLTKDPWGVKIVSTSSRQFETAKKLLLDQLLSLPLPLYTIPLSGGQVLTLKMADIVAEDVDAIVNAANGSLLHSGGVAWAIDKASGGAVQAHSRAYMKRFHHKDLTVGSVAPTKAGGSLRCKHVLHAVGPNSSHPNCEDALRFLIKNILNEAKKLKVKSLAIPAISSGIFGVDKNLVARCIIENLVGYNYPKNSPLTDVRVVVIDQPTYQCFVNCAQHKGLLPPLTVKKTPSASRVDEAEGGSNLNAKGSEDKTEAVASSSSEGSHSSLDYSFSSHCLFSPFYIASKDVAAQNSECAAVLRLLVSVASKWKVLAATLGLSESIISRLSRNLDDKAKLEQVIRQWWQASAERGKVDQVEMLIAALGNSEVGEREVAVEIWKGTEVATSQL